MDELIVHFFFISSAFKEAHGHVHCKGRKQPFHTSVESAELCTEEHVSIESQCLNYEETTPSRHDFDKEQYGGPFTTKEMEDVKQGCQPPTTKNLEIIIVSLLSCIL